MTAVLRPLVPRLPALHTSVDFAGQFLLSRGWDHVLDGCCHGAASTGPMSKLGVGGGICGRRVWPFALAAANHLLRPLESLCSLGPRSFGSSVGSGGIDSVAKENVKKKKEKRVTAGRPWWVFEPLIKQEWPNGGREGGGVGWELCYITVCKHPPQIPPKLQHSSYYNPTWLMKYQWLPMMEWQRPSRQDSPDTPHPPPKTFALWKGDKKPLPLFFSSGVWSFIHPPTKFISIRAQATSLASAYWLLPQGREGEGVAPAYPI